MGQDRCNSVQGGARIAVGVGTTSACKHALRWAATNLITSPDDTLILLHVVSTVPPLPMAFKEASKFSLGMVLERDVVLCQSEATPDLFHHYLKSVVEPMLDGFKELLDPCVSVEVHVARSNSKRKGILEACGKLHATHLVLGTQPLGMLRRRKDICGTGSYFMKHTPCRFAVYVIRNDKVVAHKDADVPTLPCNQGSPLLESPSPRTPSGRRRSLDLSLLRGRDSSSSLTSLTSLTSPWTSAAASEFAVAPSRPRTPLAPSRPRTPLAPSRPVTPLVGGMRRSESASVWGASAGSEDSHAPLDPLAPFRRGAPKPASEPVSNRNSMSQEDELKREMARLQLMMDNAERGRQEAELCAIRAHAEVEAKKVKAEHEMLEQVRFALLRGGVQ